VNAKFIEPMLLLRTDKLQEGAAWMYEIKFDVIALSLSNRRKRSTFAPATTENSDP
jgi:hypothetical protein